MEQQEYKNIFENEESHFFYVANHKILLTLLERYLNKHPQHKKVKILDAGCGTGLLAKRLQQYGKVYGVDMSKYALAFSKKRNVDITGSSIVHLPFKKNKFGVIMVIDVLYHKKIRDDISALKELYRVLTPGGVLILRVAAYKWLKLSHDLYVHTRERYNKQELEDKLKSIGFIVDKISFVNFSLLPFTIIKHLIEKIEPHKKPASSIHKVPWLINKVLTVLLSLESGIILRSSLPIGLGLIAVCTKSDE